MVIKIENKEKAEKIDELVRSFSGIVGVSIFDSGFLRREIKIYYVGREDKGFEEEVRKSLTKEVFSNFKIDLCFVMPRPAPFETYCN